MTNNKMVVLYDKNAEVAETLASFGDTVHSWHPRNAAIEEVISFPVSGGILLKHGGSFEDFRDMMKVYLRLDNAKISSITSLHWRGNDLAKELEEAVGPERMAR